MKARRDSSVGCSFSQDLLAVDAAGLDGVDRHALGRDLAGQALGPQVQGRLGRHRGIEAARLHGAADVDDAAPAALAHAGQQGRRQTARRGEVERKGLLPEVLAGIDRRRPRAAGAIDQDVDLAEGRGGLPGEAGKVIGRGDVGRDRRHVAVPLDPVDPPRRGGHPHTLLGQEAGDTGADAGAGACDQAGAVLELEVHRPLMDDRPRLANSRQRVGLCRNRQAR